jgi:hypothetical protein
LSTSRRLRLLPALALALAASQPVWAQACEAPVAEASLGTERSRWTEVDSRGKQVVKESGRLRTVSIGGSIPCAGWMFATRLQHAQGTRDYDGQSNTGAALQSTSDIERLRVQLEAMRPLTEALSVGAQLDWTQLDRGIAGAGAVQGYPERYRYAQAGLGARYVLADAAGMRLGVEAWLGGGPGGHVTASLPGRDAVRLSLGVTLASAETEKSDMAGWGWSLRLDLRRETTAAGEVGTVYRNGLPVGGAQQPKFSQTALGLDAALRYRF